MTRWSRQRLWPVPSCRRLSLGLTSLASYPRARAPTSKYARLRRGDGIPEDPVCGSGFDLALHEEAIAEKWDPLTMEIL
jgi:hypothetical protein